MSGRQIFVKVAQHAVAAGSDTLVTLGLGSCVAILLHDPVAKVGGMAHVLLPDASMARDASNPSKFVDTAVPKLVDEITARGGRTERLSARLAGGASMFTNLMTPGTLNMGERNVTAARKALEAMGIPVTNEAVGADFGRSVRFRPSDGVVTVSSVGKEDVTL